MTAEQIKLLLPLLIAGYGAAIVMVVSAFKKTGVLTYATSITTLALSSAAVMVSNVYAPATFTQMIVVDQFSLFFIAIINIAAIFCLIMSRSYIEEKTRYANAYYVLVLFAVFGMQVMTASQNLVTFFLGLETLGVALYALIGYTKTDAKSLEAALKYFVLAAASSAVMIFGLALLYFDLGTLDIVRVANVLAGFGKDMASVTSYVGLAMLLAGFGYKLAFAPFHMWSPDVYEGAPAPVTAFIATASKGAALAVLLRLFSSAYAVDGTVVNIISILAIATMFAGNLLALMQKNVKRMLAYSSVAHIGYLLIPFAAIRPEAASAAVFYIAAYFVTVISAFAVVSTISIRKTDGDACDIRDYRGLAKTNPFMAAVMSIALLSLTGMPLTAGFIGKFYIFKSAADSGLWTLVIIAVVNSGISAFYYIRLLINMYMCENTENCAKEAARPAGIVIAAGVASLAVIVFGVYPTPLIELAKNASNFSPF